jgi:hypothetical protein
MKVICIDDTTKDPNRISGFTKGFVYVVEKGNASSDYFLLKNDINRTVWDRKSKFIPLEEWREQRINTILNS